MEETTKKDKAPVKTKKDEKETRQEPFNEKMKREFADFVKKGVIDIDLQRPIVINNAKVEILHLDFNRLSAKDMIDAEAQWIAQFGQLTMVASHSMSYRLIVGAKASGALVEDFLNTETGLTPKDATAVSNVVISFLTV